MTEERGLPEEGLQPPAGQSQVWCAWVMGPPASSWADAS